MRTPSAIAVPLAAGALRSTATIYKGVTIRETAATPLVVRIWDNPTAASGNIIDTISVPASGVVSYMWDGGIEVARGLFVEVLSGTTFEGSVRLG